jgi:uncharacterized protein YutE (UPF0331/DUF86 family)
MVDSERVDRLLARIADDLRRLAMYGERGDALLDDDTALAAAKYSFVTAIEGCARIAQHIVASEGWPVPETNADAVRRLGRETVVPAPVAEAIARAVGFRNILVHEYADVDDARVVDNLRRITDLERFVASVAAWVARPDETP